MHISLKNLPAFSCFKLEIIQKIFEKFGQLEPGCFCIFEKHFTDEVISFFHYPTDMNEQKAEDFVVELAKNISSKTIDQILLDIS